MTEGIVNSVLGKLADVVVKEVSCRHGIDQEMEKVSDELSRIQCFLKDADWKHITDARQKDWLEEVRNVTYSIEDVLDTFLLEVPQKPRSSRTKDTMMNWILKKIKEKIPVHKLVDGIKQIQTNLHEIQADRVTYGITFPGEDHRPNRLHVRPSVLYNIDPDIVGFEADRDYLVKKLLDETIKRRSGVSIWGPGGLGKSTLAQKVYNWIDVKAQFGVRIWVVISKAFDLTDTLRQIAGQLTLRYNQHELKIMETTDPFDEIRKFLKDTKYLIILDDVWSTNDIRDIIQFALPDENNGSRVLITTRMYPVAYGFTKSTDFMCEPYKLGILTDKLSKELLVKSAFPWGDLNVVPPDLSDILDQFIQKCDGLPLALKNLGGVLSVRYPSYPAWSTVLGNMSSYLEEILFTPLMAISYEDLPAVVQSCFMYFAAFPKDYNIHAPSLIQMWIAEDFIPHVNDRTLEESAEQVLEEIIGRNMVQFVYRSKDGSIKFIRVNNLFLDLAINKAKKKNFLVVYLNPDDQWNFGARRVAIHNLDCDVMLSKNLRTLLCFGNGRMPNCSKQRLLKVVSTGDGYDTKTELEMFMGLPYLRYLKLNGTLEAIGEQQNRNSIGSTLNQEQPGSIVESDKRLNHH
ncbi:disease resistance protein RPP13-like [Carex rostrata]